MAEQGKSFEAISQGENQYSGQYELQGEFRLEMDGAQIVERSGRQEKKSGEGQRGKQMSQGLEVGISRKETRQSRQGQERKNHGHASEAGDHGKMHLAMIGGIGEEADQGRSQKQNQRDGAKKKSGEGGYH